MKALPTFGAGTHVADVGRRAAAVGVVSSSSRPAKAAAQRAVTAFVRRAGTWFLRTSEPDPRQTFGLSPDGIADAVSGVLPHHGLLGLVLPRQVSRRRLIAVVETASGAALVKLDADPTGVDREAAVLAALGGRPLGTVSTPALLAAGRVSTPEGEVAAVAQAAVTRRPHRPALDADVAALCAALAERLAGVVGTPPVQGWVPSHGDLSPWNLRRTDRGLALVDWETVTHAPAGTDAAYYAACVAAITGRAMPAVGDEVRAHLLDELAGRSAVEDVELTDRLRSALRNAPPARR